VAVALGAALGKPTLGIHHLEGHLLSPFLTAGEIPPERAGGEINTLAFPFVALLVSGGHTQLMQVDGVGRYTLLGETIDDAAGEAFDKSAKLLGLGYPGGPALERLAAGGRDDAYALPRPLLHSGTLDFSFAGLKTAVMTRLRALGESIDDVQRADMAASAEAAIVDVLVAKTLRALQASGLRRLVVAGGVGANLRLRRLLDAAAAPRGIVVHYPPLSLCTDNGAMIALAGAMRLDHGLAQPTRDGIIDVRPRWPLDDL
jgi:N6-L-threonylcarbamoyladenine synthase